MKQRPIIQFDIITIFTNIFQSYFNESILRRAQARGLIKIKIHNLRNWATGKHRSVDDRPYGGGPGMVMRADVIYRAIRGIIGKPRRLTGSGVSDGVRHSSESSDRPKASEKLKIILLSADGKQLDQKMAYRFSKLKRIVFICGRYEGVDARVEKFVDEKISVGPYVLTGGELPAMTIVDAVTRLIPGVIRTESLNEETFTIRNSSKTRTNADWDADKRGSISVNLRGNQRKSAYKEYPQYTRPEALTFRQKGAIINPVRGREGPQRASASNGIKTLKVPKVLLSGNHEKIRQWRTKQIK